MVKVYLYPKSRGTKDNPGNQYMNCFVESFKQDGKYKVINHTITGKETIDLLFNCTAKLFIFSWVESMVFSLVGKLQFLFVALLLFIYRLLGKDIVWVFHNKHPHYGDTSFSRFAMKTMAQLSTRVITHSSYGVKLFDEQYPEQYGKCIYIPHPVYDTNIIEPREPKWNYIIWGEVNPRKGILEFLEYAQNHSFYKEKKILICGLCRNMEYVRKIEDYCNERVKYINRFIYDDELRTLISESEHILFTYSSDSVLSSGSLIYSLNFCKPIIGPNVGNFVDLKGIVTCFSKFSDIERMDVKFNPELCKRYIHENQWKNMPKKIETIISDLHEGI